MTDRVTDTYMAYQFIKRLNTPFEHWEAFKLGIIDATGKVLIRRNKLTNEQLHAWGRFDVLVANLKRLLAKLPSGNTKLATLAATVLLLKEEEIDENNMAMLQEQLERHIAEMTELDQELPQTNLIEGFRILGKTAEPPEGTGVPHKVVKFHQSRANGWCVQVLDKHDNQVGDADYIYHKADAEHHRRQLAKQHGINEDNLNLLEDAPISNVGGGQIAGVGVGPNGEPGVGKKALKRYKRKNQQALPNQNLFTRKSLG
jgi:hypothetical protein